MPSLLRILRFKLARYVVNLDDRVLGKNADEPFLELNSIQLIMRPHKMSLIQMQLRK